jgi:organic radical activating enzyme
MKKQPKVPEKHLLVRDIYYCVYGEGIFIGSPTVVLQLAGCNFSCPGCTVASLPGTLMSIPDIVSTVRQIGINRIMIAGAGEPLFQPESSVVDLIWALEAGIQRPWVGLRTHGSYNADFAYKAVDFISLALKLRSSNGGRIYFKVLSNIIEHYYDKLEITFEIGPDIETDLEEMAYIFRRLGLKSALAMHRVPVILHSNQLKSLMSRYTEKPFFQKYNIRIINKILVELD